jgi:type IX secretion system PorP/SprF family membrane protein
MRIVKCVCVILLLSLNCLGQDAFFSQFYNAPNHLNPALNGQFDGDLRVNFIHRSSMVALASPLTYSAFSVDYNVPRFGGGFGLLAMRSNEGSPSIKRTTLSGIYSYSVQWDYAILSFGLTAGVGNLKYDQSKSVYGDQIDAGGIIPGGVTNATMPYNNNRYYFDSGAGVNFVFFDAMVGLSVNHINRANESFTNTDSKIPMRFTSHASYHFALDRYDPDNGPAIIPSVVYYKQLYLNSLSAGLQFKSKRVRIGGWYRNEFGTKWYRKEFGTKESFVLSLSFDIFSRSDSYDKVRLGVSHDATLSKIGYSASGGSTEGALTWESTLKNNDGNRSENFGKRCYDFY